MERAEKPVHWFARTELACWMRYQIWPFVVRWACEVAWLLEYEPTWFPEFGFGIGAIGWGLGGLVTDDMIVKGWGWVLPVLAIILGLARCAVLLRLWYAARVVLSSLSALLWGFMWCALAGRYGVVPSMGLVGGAFIIEMLTAAKFSIPCVRDLRNEWVAGRNAR